MKYDLIFSDYDGTLLGADGVVGERSAAAIRGYVRRGGNFVVCTGRMNDSIGADVRRRLGIENELIPVVGFQGAYIVDGRDNPLYADGLSPDNVIRIIRRAEELGLHVHTYDPDTVYIGRADEIMLKYNRVTGARFCEVGDLAAFVDAHRDKVYPKTMVVAAEGEGERAKKQFDCVDLPGVEHYMSSPTYIEFMSITAGKGNALRRVAAALGVPIGRTIAVGDNQNDISMIRAAGLGVAVGNALDCVKAVADYVTPVGDADPLAHIIEKFC